MRLVSIPVCAEIFEIHPATVRLRIKNGQWPFYSLGERSIRVDVDEIKSLLHSPGKGGVALKEKLCEQPPPEAA